MDRTYAPPPSFPIEGILDQRRQQAAKREHRQYQLNVILGNTNVTATIEDVEMASVTHSIEGMSMNYLPRF